MLFRRRGRIRREITKVIDGLRNKYLNKKKKEKGEHGKDEEKGEDDKRRGCLAVKKRRGEEKKNDKKENLAEQLYRGENMGEKRN